MIHWLWDGSEAILSGINVDTEFVFTEFMPSSSTRKMLEEITLFSEINNMQPYKVTIIY